MWEQSIASRVQLFQETCLQASFSLFTARVKEGIGFHLSSERFNAWAAHIQRCPAFEYAGALLQVMARGNGREEIFRAITTPALFLKTLGEARAMTGWRIHGWIGGTTG